MTDAVAFPVDTGATHKTGNYLYVASVVLLCAWVLVPLYFLFINTLSSPATVNSSPKSFIPEFDLGSLTFFAGFAGMLTALKNSILVAGMTMILSILIKAPAGYALSRFDLKDRGIAMVFQNYAVFPHLTVFENIEFGLRMQKLPNDEVKRRVERTATLMHIEQQLKRYSGELSGGLRQRVAVARALAMEPDVILMDEPLSNLDALLRLEMRAELKGVLAESKTTTIYVTHDQVEAMSLADRISVMHQGKIVQSATPIEVYRNPAAEFVAGFIGNPPMNFLSAAPAGEGKWTVAGQVVEGPRHNKGPLQFAIRPEDINPAETGLSATAKVVEPLGAHLLVTCEVDGRSFRAVLDSDLIVRPGDRLTLAPQPDRVRWFDPETTLAVA